MQQQRHENSLDALRLIAALAVVAAHLHDVPSALYHRSLPSHPLMSLADVGVMTFFIISGYVNYLSFERNPSPISYYQKRAWRILPAYAAAVLLQTAAFWWIFRDQVFARDIAAYLAANLTTLNFLMPTFVPGIEAINGSLWTIKVELAYYLLLPLLFPVIRSRHLILLMLGSLLFAAFVPSATLARQLPGALFLFLTGAAFARFPGLLSRAWPWLLVGSVAAAILALSYAGVSRPTVGRLELHAVFGAAALVALFLRTSAFPVPLDVSYTVYLVHYPIILAAYVLGLVSYGVWAGVSLLGASLIGAAAVTVLIERPFSRHHARNVSSIAGIKPA